MAATSSGNRIDIALLMCMVVSLAAIPWTSALALSEQDVGVRSIRAALTKMAHISDPSTLLTADPLTGLPSLHKICIKSLEVRASSIEGAGMGVFATRNIPRGAIVSLYPTHGLGVDFGESSQCFGLEPSDQDFFNKKQQTRDIDTDEQQQKINNYLHFIMGSRPLMPTVDTKNTFKGYPLFVDVNPHRPTCPGWYSHFVNDGAVVLANTEDGVLSYYAATRRAKNCVQIPFGPSPLMATVTTKKVKKGQELFSSYGCSYWLEALLEAQQRSGDNESEYTEITEAIQQQVKESAKDLFAAMQQVQLAYVKEAKALQVLFDTST